MTRKSKIGILIEGSAKGATKALDLTADGVQGLANVTSKAANKVNRSSKSMVDSLTNVATRAAKWGAATTAAATAAGIALTKAGLSSVDTLAKTSDKLGVATESLARFRFAAEQTGVAQNKADIALQRFTRRLADAAAGSGPAVKAFEALNLSADELIKLSPDQAFAKVAEQMNKVENQSQKVSLAFKLFDSEGVALVNTLALGEEGLNALGNEAEILGLTLSRVDAAKVEQANDSMNRIKRAAQGLGQQLAVKVAPFLKVVADRLFGAAKEAGGMGKVATSAFNSIIKSAGQVGNIIKFIRVGWIDMRLGLQKAALEMAKSLDKFAKSAVDIWNRLPWVDEVAYTSVFESYALSMESAIEDSKDKIDEILSEPLPSVAIDDFVADVERASQEMADTVVAGQQEIQDEVITTTEITETLATTTKKTTEEMSKAWADSRTTLSNFFFEFARDGKDAFENLLSSFQAMLSKMVAEAAANKILVSVGAAVGSAGFSGTANALTSAGGGSLNIGSALSGGNSLMNLLGGGFSSLGGAYQTAGTYLGDLAQFVGTDNVIGNFLGNAALDSTFTGIGYQYGTAGSSLANLGLNVGAGFAGNYLGQQVFGGNTTGIGSAAGGLVGSIWGPVGTGIGSFLGEGLETGLGNLLGFGSGGSNQAVADFVGGDFTSRGVGNNFDQKNLDAVDALAAQMATLADVVGNETFSGRLRVGNKNGLQFKPEGADDGIRFDSASELLDFAFDQILEGAEGLSPAIRDLARNFTGATEELIPFVASLRKIEELSSINVVSDAIAAFNSEAVPMVRVVNQNEVALRQSIQAYDGSAEAAADLAGKLSRYKADAFQFALAIQEIGASIKKTAEEQARGIRESVLSQEQLRNNRLRERDNILSRLSEVEDPEKLAERANRVLELNALIYNSLEEGARTIETANEFAGVAERVDEIVEGSLGRKLSDLQGSEDSLNAIITDKMGGMVERQEQATESFAQAVVVFAGAANSFAAFAQTSAGSEVAA